MAGSNNFVLSTKQWILSTNHLLLIHEYQRLKAAKAEPDSHFSDDCAGIDWGKQVIEIN
ncbi:hypothetical protein [Fibrobacter sp. UWCM]|uniref:hypothetical protein n=1 Tax=Fibrobacter sp. UWCM TaxID=1896208 RepID=UPI001C31B1C6|nr:hypothetical protein [Fibrobacter sp. UWCM]